MDRNRNGNASLAAGAASRTFSLNHPELLQQHHQAYDRQRRSDAAEQPGAKVRLTVARSGSTRVVTATLGAAA